jgi:signal transduction histidine kinase
MTNWLPYLVARVPATVHSKLLVAFLAIVALLIAVGIVGLQLLGGVNRRAEELVQLQRKIAAYRQLQHDTTAQLYSVASALLVNDERALAATLRQLNQFTYNFDRFAFVAKDEVELLDQVRQDYNRFVRAVSEAVELIRSGKMEDGKQLQIAQANPLAERLELRMNQLVNRAGANMVDSVEANAVAYTQSRWVVIGFAGSSIFLALILGYAFSWSLIGPVKEINAHLKQIASGNFSRHVQVQNRDELGTLAANLNRMNDELGQLYQQLHAANRHKSQFLANVNHELRTPVSAIIGYGRLLLRETQGQIAPLQAENIRDLIREAERLLGMIDSLLDFAKIEAGKIEIHVEPVAIHALVQGVTATIEPILNNEAVRLVRDIPLSIATIHTDREKLHQIIVNLIGNAAKFTDRGEITISARQQNGSFKLAVADTGIGIEAADLNQIFEEFHRGRLTGDGRFHGTGLGLAITKNLVDLLGGSIAVESEVGKGSTFTVTLPMEASKG